MAAESFRIECLLLHKILWIVIYLHVFKAEILHKFWQYNFKMNVTILRLKIC